MDTSNLEHIYYINLDRSVERREQFVSTFGSEYSLHRISAYDGSENLSKYTDIHVPSPDSTDSSTREIGCSLSHIKAIWTAFKDGLDRAIIMEDDCANKYASLWNMNDTFSSIGARAPSDADCIIFSCVNPLALKRMLKMKKEFSPWNSSRWGTACYMIRRSGMRKIISRYVTHSGKIDLQKCSSPRNLTADIQILYTCMNSYSYTRPTVCTRTECGSEIKSNNTGHAGFHDMTNSIIKKWFAGKTLRQFDSVRSGSVSLTMVTSAENE